MNTSEIKAAAMCEHAYELSQYKLRRKKAYSSDYEALELLKKGVSDNLSYGEIIAMIEEYYSNAYTTGDVLACATDHAKEVSKERVIRILKYIFDQNLNTCTIKCNVSVTADFSGKTGSIEFDSLTENVDLLFIGEDCTRAVKFSLGESTYTKRKNSSNHVSLAPELAVIYKALKPAFHNQTLFAEMWFFKAKNEKDDLIEVYEAKEGKNIVSVDYSKEAISPEEAIKRLIENNNQNDCDHCKHARICKACSINDIAMIHSEAEVQKPANPQFTKDQLIAINHINGAMNVLAGPGSGKSTTFAYRLKNMIDNGIDPYSILMITFTKKAAKELREKAKKVCGLGDDLNIFTFHSFGYQLLAENPIVLGSQPALAEDTERKRLIEDALNQVPLINGVSYFLPRGEYGIINTASKWISQIEKEGINDFILKHPKLDTNGIILLYDRFMALYKEHGYLSYDDQITKIAEILNQYPKYAALYANKYKYIMVDEFQDADKAQAEMIYAIAKVHGNIAVVGDDDQQIYKWRGADGSFLTDFKRDFPNALTVRLGDNFRSTKQILAAAGAVIESNSARIEKDIVGHKESSVKPCYVEYANPQILCDWVSKALSKYKPGDIAVLARKNSTLYKLEQELTPFVGVNSPKDYLIEDPLFNVYYSLFSMYMGEDDDEALYSLLKWFGVTKIPCKDKKDSSFMDFLIEKGLMPPLDSPTNALYKRQNESELHHAAYILRTCFDAMDNVVLLQDLLIELGKLLGMPQNLVSEKLSDIVVERCYDNVDDFYAHLKDMVTYTDKTRVGYEAEPSKVNLLTCHDSKGKEFPVVFIYGMEEFDTSEDDNNLLYVSMTRAKEVLVMMCNDQKGYVGYDNLKPFVTCTA